MKKKKQFIFYIAAISVMAVLCVVMLTGVFKNGIESANDYISIEPTIKKTSTSLFKDEETVISIQVLNDGLRDMGTLVTAEYYFTDIASYTNTETYFKFITSEVSFAYSYDGVVLAGIDFTKITVDKDDSTKTITITLPKSEIISVDIDTTSFKKYSERSGFLNKLELEDYNTSLTAFKDKAKQNAIDRNILVNADKQAVTIVRNFVKGIVGDDYTIAVK